MPAAAKIAALFEQLTREDVDAMLPAQRERFAQVCRHWADFAEIRPEPARKSGILVDLATRRRDE
jgi:hypothetical protein